VGELNSIF